MLPNLDTMSPSSPRLSLQAFNLYTYLNTYLPQLNSSVTK